VQGDYTSLIRKLGGELDILLETPEEDLRRAGSGLLAEAIRRMRTGRVSIEAGYDGEYGKIRVFSPEDRKSLAQESLFIGAPPEIAERPVRRGRKRLSDQPGGAAAARKPDDQADGSSAGPGTGLLRAAQMRPSYSSDDSPSRNPERPESVGGGRESPDRGFPLNAEQKAAADHGEGHALVLAGPGTGKTRVLAARLALLVRDRGVSPERILAITFTNKAAGEIRARVLNFIDGLETGGRAPAVSTFHAFGHSLLREHADRFGRDRAFRIADEEDVDRFLRSVSPEGADVRRSAERLRRSRRKSGPGAAPEDAEWKALLERYETRLRSENMFDFDDLLVRTLRLLQENPELLRGIRRRYAHILVDEFQDLDEVQYEWMRLLAGPDSGPESGRLWAVGDPDQSVYGFRGASPEFIRRFPEDFPGTTVYTLTRSYRCPDTVLRASGMVLEKRFEPGGASSPHFSSGNSGRGEEIITDYELQITNEKREKDPEPIGRDLQGTSEDIKVRIVRHSTDAGEAEFVARTIEAMTGGVRFFSMDSGITAGAEENPLGFSDFAVLCRIGRQFQAFEKAFRDHGIPFLKSDTEPFYRREPLRSVVRVLRETNSRFKEGSEFPVSDSGFKKSDGSAPAAAVENEPVRRLIEIAAASIPAASDPENRPYVDLLSAVAEPFGEDLRAFITSLDLGTGLDWVRPDIEAVALTTLHAAKGLEFSCVFIAGVEDGLLPYTLFDEGAGNAGEERRLLYVGMTRARQHLILSHAEKRLLYGRTWTLPRSPFLDDIEASLLKTEKSRGPAGRGSGRFQMDLF
jgi:DNA helicase II / ATP-dependent DNA helicase PcrA